MTLLFDTSSLVTVILDQGGRGVDQLFDEYVLDLTFYETGNVIWKAHALQDRLDADDLERLLSFLERLESQVTVLSVDSLEFERTMEVAVDEELTFYDAAYVACAERDDHRLVTEDRELRSCARSYVDTISVQE